MCVRQLRRAGETLRINVRLIEIFVSNNGFVIHPHLRTDSAVSIIKASLAKRLT